MINNITGKIASQAKLDTLAERLSKASPRLIVHRMPPLLADTPMMTKLNTVRFLCGIYGFPLRRISSYDHIREVIKNPPSDSKTANKKNQNNNNNNQNQKPQAPQEFLINR